MSKFLFTGGVLIDPESGLEAPGDLLVCDGTIEAIGHPGEIAPGGGIQELAVQGLWVTPGLIDVHVHLRDPGFPQKETIRSGLLAAAAGGFCAVAAMANTLPVNDNVDVTGYMLQRAAEVRAATLIPVGAVTLNLEGREPVDYHALAQAGVRMFSDDGMPVDDQVLLLQALEQVNALGLVISLHEEDRELSQNRAVRDGNASRVLAIPGIPPDAESKRVRRDLALAIGAGVPLHLAHISTRESVELVRAARRHGAQITCEVTPHHFSLTDGAVLEFGADAKMNPPLQSESDVQALRDAMHDGTVDMIATDHAPHDPVSKQSPALERCFDGNRRTTALSDAQAKCFQQAANGVVGLETSVALSLELVRAGVIDRRRMIEMMSLNPARLLRLGGGKLQVGAPADITVIDPDRVWEVRPEEFHSRSRNTPFAGRRLKGRAVLTMVAGQVMHDIRSAA